MCVCVCVCYVCVCSATAEAAQTPLYIKALSAHISPYIPPAAAHLLGPAALALMSTKV
jgi:hypothetical protein